MKDFLKKKKSSIINFNMRKSLKNKDFTIISNNCWGGQVYSDLGLQYNTPFVGLFIFAPDYIKMLKNLHYHLGVSLSFTRESKFLDDFNHPVGLLDDIEIHFLHYKNEMEAEEKWNKRLSRMNMNNLFIKFCDRDLCTEELLKEYEGLEYENKICFTSKQHNYKSTVWFTEFKNSDFVDNEMNVYKKYFNVVNWLNSGMLIKI